MSALAVTLTVDELEALMTKAVAKAVGRPTVVESPVLTREEAAKLLKVHPNVVSRYVLEMGLPARRLGKRPRDWRILRQEFDAWVHVSGGAKRLRIVPPMPSRAARTAQHVPKRSLRLAVVARDGLRCRLCGQDVERSQLHLDHVRPVSRGGETTLENLQVTPARCNARKGARLP